MFAFYPIVAVGEIVGYDVKSTSGMNNGVVSFFDHFDKVGVVVEKGVMIRDVPPFSIEMLERELARNGQIMSPIRLIPLGFQSLDLKHVEDRLKDNKELNLVFKFRVDDYTVYASSENMKCFRCEMEGQPMCSCPEKNK